MISELKLLVGEPSESSLVRWTGNLYAVHARIWLFVGKYICHAFGEYTEDFNRLDLKEVVILEIFKKSPWIR